MLLATAHLAGLSADVSTVSPGSHPERVSSVQVDLLRSASIVRSLAGATVTWPSVEALISASAADELVIAIDTDEGTRFGGRTGGLCLIVQTIESESRSRLLVAAEAELLDGALETAAERLVDDIGAVARDLGAWGGYVTVGHQFEWTQYELEHDLTWEPPDDLRTRARGEAWVVWLGEGALRRLGGARAVAAAARQRGFEVDTAEPQVVAIRATRRVRDFDAATTASMRSIFGPALRIPDPTPTADARPDAGELDFTTALIDAFGYDPRDSDLPVGGRPSPSPRPPFDLDLQVSGYNDPLYVSVTFGEGSSTREREEVDRAVHGWLRIEREPDDHISDVDGPVRAHDEHGRPMWIWTVDAALASEETLRYAVDQLAGLPASSRIVSVALTGEPPAELSR